MLVLTLEYPHVEKSRIFGNRISKVGSTVAHNCHSKRTNLTVKELTSRQKEKPHGKKKNLTAKRITSWQKEKPYGKKNNLMAN